MLQDLSFVRIRQQIECPREGAAGLAVQRELSASRLLDGLAPGARLAVAVGSRRIAGIAEVTRATVAAARERGLSPFLVAAMGSHGGGTAAGQLALLHELGLDEPSLGCPVHGDMAAAPLGHTEEGLPVWFDALAARADAILAIGRVKPHTAFAGRIGSGPLKMLAIGLGKREGAEAVHSWAIGHGGLEAAIRSVAGFLISRLPVRGALALVENAEDALARVQAIRAADLGLEEPRLLELAARLRPGLPVAAADLLILDRIGKDISGTGMDPWVVGRLMALGEPEPGRPRITRIYARALSPGSQGNAHGVGLADLVHRRLGQAIDWPVTRTNALAAGAPQKARLPLQMDSDREAIAALLRVAGVTELPQARVIWARDTRDLLELRVSAALVEEATGCGRARVIGPFEPLDFDAQGDLVPA
jgi:hypothetical protein